MTNPHGSFIWYELITVDADAAQAFYADVIGWSIAPSGMPDIDYRLLTAPDGELVGGLMQRADIPPIWLGYVAVDDVDAAVAAVLAAGGAVQMPPTDAPGVGRMAMVADPQGSPIYLMRGADETPSQAFQDSNAATPGHAVWNELTAADPGAAIAFYTGHFGWRQEGAMPMGPLGDYSFLQHGDGAIGAVMGMVPNGRAGWQYYFHVADIDAAAARVTAGGGAVVQPPMQIPGGAYSLVAEDPRSARFGLVGPRVGG